MNSENNTTEKIAPQKNDDSIAPLIYGVAYGLIMRLLFGLWPLNLSYNESIKESVGLMSGSFVFLMPICLGAIVVFRAEKYARRSWFYYVSAPWVTMVLFLVGTALMLLEGSICIAIMSPLFMFLASIGGLLAGVCVRLIFKKSRTSLNTVAILPILSLFVEGNVYLPNQNPQQIHTVSKTIQLNATKEVVWDIINNVQNIQADEVGNAYIYKIGVPTPISGITQIIDGKHVRQSKWAKNVYFDEIIDIYEPYKTMSWHYKFHADSFPKNALDDHVTIGGQYFDLVDTSYTIIDNGSHRNLNLKFSYRVNTSFNIYAQPVAQLLLGDFAENILRMYKNRLDKVDKVKILDHQMS